MQALNTRRAAMATQAGASPLRPRLQVARAPARSSHVARVMEIEGLDAWEEHVLKSDKFVLVDFWAVWCGPCKLVAPLMDWAEKEYGQHIKVVKVNHTPNPELVAQHKVYGLPTLMVFKDGKLVPGSHREGAISKPVLQKYIEQHILALVEA